MSVHIISVQILSVCVMSVSSDSDIFLEELPVIFIATYSRVVVSGLMLSNVSISPKSSSSSFSYAVSVSLSF